MIGNKVRNKSFKPFKSGLKIHTVKGIIEHPELWGVEAYTFEEDDSYVRVSMCIPASYKFYYTYKGRKNQGKGHIHLESIFKSLRQLAASKWNNTLYEVDIFSQEYSIPKGKHVRMDTIFQGDFKIEQV